MCSPKPRSSANCPRPRTSSTTPCGKVGALALYTEFGHGAFEDASLRVIAAAAPDIEMFMRLRDRAMLLSPVAH